MNNPFDATRLDEELKAVGLKIHGCSSMGRIDWIAPPSEAEQTLAAAILASHDKTIPRVGEAERIARNLLAHIDTFSLSLPPELIKFLVLLARERVRDA